MSFAARVRRARKHAGLSQTEVAAALHLRRTAVSQWESPEGTRPTAANLANLAVLVAVRFEWLATGRGRMRIGATEAPHALAASEFAHDELEARLLIALRKIPQRKRVVIVELVEGLTR